MEKSLRPDFGKLVFRQNESRSDIYDLVSKGFRKFKYFRLSVPRSEKFTRQGAKYIIESWKDNIKILFSGLIRYSDNIYFGDHRSNNGKKSFIIAVINQPDIILYYFNSFSLYPKERKGFIAKFINESAGQPHPAQVQNQPELSGSNCTKIQ